MFLTGLLSGAGLDSIDPEQERDPPPLPTNVSFPEYDTCGQTKWSEQSTLPDFSSLFAKIQRPKDVSLHHLEALNIEICPPCAPDELLPLAADGTSYYPPQTPAQAITPASYADATKADPAVSRKRKDFDDRLAELRVDNDTAYRTLSRKLRNGTRAPKLAAMRKFWESLESMSRYWDCSLDEYYEVPAAVVDDGAMNVKRRRTDRVPLSALENHHSEPRESDLSTADKGSRTASPESKPRQRYKGLRTYSGNDMPDQFRVDTIRAFVEGTIWPFGCSLAPPRVMPLVQFGKLNLPVRQTAAVYRLPKDRATARQGRLEGPLIAVQVRNETGFGAGSGQSPGDDSRLDLMRELGGLLQLAQERRREGRADVKPGEGKWWTERPRWGGGPGDEVGQEGGNSDVVQAADEILNGLKAQNGVSNRSRKRKTPLMLWEELKCGSGYWDSKTDYMAIGKEPAKLQDEVFMVSSLNHHVSILKLTVHDAYTDYLLSGTKPQPLPNDAAWCRPKLQRTKWYDLFDMQQRVEAFRSLWGVTAYLTREAAAVQPGDAEMRGTA